MAYCDYCSCKECQQGSKYLSYCQTIEHKNICDVCYYYECCLNAQELAGEDKDPCKDLNCKHRPQLISEWKTFDETKKETQEQKPISYPG
jgi:hypothetical protein